MPVLKIRSKLDRSNKRLVQREESSPPVVVKPAVKYHKEAHKQLAARAMCRCCTPLHARVPVIGERDLVVMERVKGKRVLDYEPLSLPGPNSVFEDMENGLQILHEAGLVFGNLREANIMILEKDSKGRIGVNFEAH